MFNMETLNAKSVDEVKEWLKRPHHFAMLCDKSGNETDDKPGTGTATHFLLQGKTDKGKRYRVIMPREIWMQCFVTGFGVPDTHMYQWDELQEQCAADVGHFVTTSDETYIFIDPKDNTKKSQVGCRQGVLVGVSYLYINGSNFMPLPFYKVVGQLGTYFMLADGQSYTRVLTYFEDTATFINEIRATINLPPLEYNPVPFNKDA